MPKIFSIALVLSIAFLTSGYMPVSPPSCPPGAISTRVAEPEAVVRSYLLAVDRGELLSFERKLSRDEINPIRVQYNYRIMDGSTEVRVYSALKAPMSVPGQSGYQVIGVCSAMEDGRIVETESHVLLK